MTPLQIELLRVMNSGHQPPLMASSFPAILFAVGAVPDRVSVEDCERALEELLAAGRIQAEWRRGRRYFKALVQDPTQAAPDNLAASRERLQTARKAQCH